MNILQEKKRKFSSDSNIPADTLETIRNTVNAFKSEKQKDLSKLR